jgi:hypothetical protein
MMTSVALARFGLNRARGTLDALGLQGPKGRIFRRCRDSAGAKSNGESGNGCHRPSGNRAETANRVPDIREERR